MYSETLAPLQAGMWWKNIFFKGVRCIINNLRCTLYHGTPEAHDDTLLSRNIFTPKKIQNTKDVRMHQIWGLQNKGNANRT